MYIKSLKLIFVAILSATTLTSAFAQNENDRIIEHKSAMVYKLSTFVSWPKDTFNKKKKPIVIGVFGNEKIRKYLTNHTRDVLINGHPIKVSSISEKDDWTNLHIMYIDASASDKFSRLSDEKINDLPILTYGDSPTFDKEGGIIRIYEQDTKHRISINIDTANRKNLTIDHRLLKKAAIVTDS